MSQAITPLEATGNRQQKLINRYYDHINENLSEKELPWSYSFTKRSLPSEVIGDIVDAYKAAGWEVEETCTSSAHTVKFIGAKV